jgi:hypothetical protein
MGGRGRSVAPSLASPQCSFGAAERLRDSVAAPFGSATLPVHASARARLAAIAR